MQKHNFMTLNKKKTQFVFCVQAVLSGLYFVLSIVSIILGSGSVGSIISYSISVAIAVLTLSTRLFVDTYNFFDMRKAYKSAMFFVPVMGNSEIASFYTKIKELWIDKKDSTELRIDTVRQLEKEEYLCYQFESLLKNGPQTGSGRDAICDNTVALYKTIKKKIGYVVYFDDKDRELNEFLFSARANTSKRKLNILILRNEHFTYLIEALNRNFKCILLTRGGEQAESNVLHINLLNKSNASDCNKVASVLFNQSTADNVLSKCERVIDIIGGDITKLIYFASDPTRRADLINSLNGKYNVQERYRQLEKVKSEYRKGNYERAQKLLDDIGIDRRDDIRCDGEFAYNYNIERAYVLHLLNEYDSSLDILNKMTDIFDNAGRIEIDKSHCLKHKGDFNKAVEVLNRYRSTHSGCCETYRKEIGIQLLLAWKNGPRTKASTKAINQAKNAMKELRSLTNKSLYSEAQALYGVAIDWYKPSTHVVIPKLIKKQYNNIAHLQDKHGKLYPNAKFLLAELHRLYGNFSQAADLYFECYKHAVQNRDFNLESQSVIMIAYMYAANKTPSMFSMRDITDIHRKCIERKMEFNAELCDSLIKFMLGTGTDTRFSQLIVVL